MISGAYPSALGFYYGVVNYGRMLGRLIAAWGVAGLLAPWLAGAVFDATGGYGLAVSLACLGAALAFLVSIALPRAEGGQPGGEDRARPALLPRGRVFLYRRLNVARDQVHLRD